MVTQLRTPAASASDQPRDAQPRSGLHHDLARSLPDVMEAWGLVHHAYCRAGLIQPSPDRLHTVPQAVGPQTAVVIGRIGPVVASTMSAYIDSPLGLPLDSAYGEELQALRRAGRRLCEVGLFADRREHLSRSADSLFDMMRFAYFHGKHGGASDIIIGVHPHHAPFYRRLIGFEEAGEARPYATVSGNQVVLLKLDLQVDAAQGRLPRGLRYFLENPIAPAVFDARYRFDPAQVMQSPLAKHAPPPDRQVA